MAARPGSIDSAAAPKADPVLADAFAGTALGRPAPPSSGPRVPSHCRVHLLPDAKATDRGLVYRRGSDRFLLAWARVQAAFAAEVGEPEGVRTVVFDLAVETHGNVCVLCRFDMEPGDEGQALARAIELGVGREACSASLRALAREGLPSRQYPDLETLNEATLEAVRFRA
jgi:hypothetical protein